MVGTTISHYKVIEKIGQGGMGEVYRAEDTNLSRDVAIKVLPEQFTKDPQGLARFEREAKLLASLNHPNIAAIYGFEEADDVRFLSMELVPGENLAERVAKGPVPVEEALEICRQIAEGVEAAHEKGVIHRDLKPANVKVTPEGKVKILDFGLAKAFEDEIPVTDISQSPTLTEEMTRAGVILGTAAYMSPEQAKGKEVNKQADIFSFGTILYELLTGKRAFQGETITEILAKILEAEPNWKALPQNTPIRIKELIEDCLEKAPDDRLRDIGNARIQIKRALKDPVSPVEVASAAPPVQQRWVLTVGLVVGAAVAGLAVWLLIQPSAPEQRLNRFVITPSMDAPFLDTRSNDLAISPDGRHVVYKGPGKGGLQFYLRSLDDFEDRVIPGTEGAVGAAFFSPDGESIGFFADGTLKKVSLSGGSPITLCEIGSGGPQGSWSTEDTIVFSEGGTVSQQAVVLLYQVPAAGGEREILATPNPDKDEGMYHQPHFLPGGKAVTLSVRPRLALRQTYNVDGSIAVLSLDTGEQRIIVENGYHAYYVETGHLIYRRSGTSNLMAVPFDLTSLQVKGDSVQVLQGISGEPNADYAVSENGTLVYIPGAPAGSHEHSLVWVDRQGTETLMTQEKGDFSNPRISPDGKQVAVNIRESSGQRYLWLYDVEDDSFSRLTFDGGGTPSWSPDGQWLIFQHGDLGEYGMARQPADRSRPMEKLTSGPNRQNANSWSPDGQVVAFSENPRPSQDIGIYSLDGDGEPEYILTSPADECCAKFSPDGKWLAYVSNELGQRHVYVRPYPELDVKWLISDSDEGGDQPVWSPDGKELFYRSRDKMMVVSIQVKDQTLDTGKPRVLFEGSYASHSNPPGMQYYDISPDGQRFLMMKEEQRQEAQSEIRVIQNWSEELKRLVPTN